MKRMRQLEFLVIKLGGVAGAAAVVYRWRGVFTSSLIRTALAEKYPVLEPAPYQIQDILDWMRIQNRIQVVCDNAWELIYKIAPYQLQFKFT